MGHDQLLPPYREAVIFHSPESLPKVTAKQRTLGYAYPTTYIP
jgi:hypothetical protein